MGAVVGVGVLSCCISCTGDGRMGILLGGDGDLGAVSGVRVLLGWFSCFEGGRVVGVAGNLKQCHTPTV